LTRAGVIARAGEIDALPPPGGGELVAGTGQLAKPLVQHAVKGHDALPEVDLSSWLARSLSSSGQCG
jgi:hypothetical protein